MPEHSPLYHFSVATARGWEQDDVATLLRRVASALDELGAVDVHDITFHVDWTEEGSWPSMTVYYELDKEEDGDTPDNDDIVATAEPQSVDEPVTTEDESIEDESIEDEPIEREPVELVPVELIVPAPGYEESRLSAGETDTVDATIVEAPERDAATGAGLDATVFAIDRGREPFVGGLAQADTNGADDVDELVTPPDVVDADDAELDDGTDADEDDVERGNVVAAEAAEESEPADEVDLVAAEDDENRVVSVVERVPVVHGDDALPAPGRATPAVNVFPLRIPPGLDRPALRRLKELWRTSRRRPY